MIGLRGVRLLLYGIQCQDSVALARGVCQQEAFMQTEELQTTEPIDIHRSLDLIMSRGR